MRTVTNQQIIDMITTRGVIAWAGIVSDRTYVLPVRAWIEQDFAKALHRFLLVLKINTWLSEKNDCDNFARAACFFANLCHARTLDAPEAGLAFGVWHYTKSDGGRHAINFAVTVTGTRISRGGAEMRSNTEGLELVFFEPQSQQVIKLTQEEIESCDAFHI